MAMPDGVAPTVVVEITESVLVSMATTLFDEATEAYIISLDGCIRKRVAAKSNEFRISPPAA